MVLYKQYVQGADGMLHLTTGVEYFASQSEKYSWTTEWRGQCGSAYAYEEAVLKKGVGIRRGKKSTSCKRVENKNNKSKKGGK